MLIKKKKKKKNKQVLPVPQLTVLRSLQYTYREAKKTCYIYNIS